MCPHVFTTVIRDDGLLSSAQNGGVRTTRRITDAYLRAMPGDAVHEAALVAQFDDMNSMRDATRSDATRV